MATGRMTAEALAADFASRVNEHGWVWLTAKQVNFLRSLATPVTAHGPQPQGKAANVVSYREYGTPVIEGILPGGRSFRVAIRHNGAGCFQLEGK